MRFDENRLVTCKVGGLHSWSSIFLAIKKISIKRTDYVQAGLGFDRCCGIAKGIYVEEVEITLFFDAA